MKDWVAYYDSDHSIYVNGRHRDVHYARLADAIARYVPSPTAAVLDYGCGEALHADRVAAAAGRLTLAEAGPAVRGRLIERFKGNPRITVISTDRAASLPPQSFDMVILHSVSQYLTPQEFDQKAALFHGLLRPRGLLVVGDVVPPGASTLSDAWALLRFGWEDGFFHAAVLGLIRTFFSDYRQTANEGGAHPLQRTGDGGQARGGRVRRGAGTGQPRPPRHADDVPGAQNAGGHAAGGVTRHFFHTSLNFYRHPA
jgi:SAM-dependent methyltransferase